MLILVSHPLFFEGEAQLLNQLFKHGLSIFHLRKPDAARADCEQFLTEIHPHYRSRIALHHHQSIAGKYGIYRLHFTSQLRRQWGAQDDQRVQKKQVYSTSIHLIEEYNRLSPHFSYAFLSPVFDSISKPGYLSKPHDLKEINVPRKVQLIGLGGVTVVNAKSVLEKGYDGIALCGAIWTAERPVDEFLKMKMKWNTTDQ